MWFGVGMGLCFWLIVISVFWCYHLGVIVSVICLGFCMGFCYSFYVVCGRIEECINKFVLFFLSVINLGIYVFVFYVCYVVYFSTNMLGYCFVIVLLLGLIFGLWLGYSYGVLYDEWLVFCLNYDYYVEKFCGGKSKKKVVVSDDDVVGGLVVSDVVVSDVVVSEDAVPVKKGKKGKKGKVSKDVVVGGLVVSDVVVSDVVVSDVVVSEDAVPVKKGKKGKKGKVSKVKVVVGDFVVCYSICWLGPKDCYFNFYVYLYKLLFGCDLFNKFGLISWYVLLLINYFMGLNDGCFYKSCGESLFLSCFVIVFSDCPVFIDSVKLFHFFLSLEFKYYFGVDFKFSLYGLDENPSCSYYLEVVDGVVDYSFHYFFGDSFCFVNSFGFRIVNLSSDFSLFYFYIVSDFFSSYSDYVKYRGCDFFIPYFNFYSLSDSFSCVILVKDVGSICSGSSYNYMSSVSSGLCFNLVFFCCISFCLDFFNSLFLSVFYTLCLSSSKCYSGGHVGNFRLVSGCSRIIFDGSFLSSSGLYSDKNIVVCGFDVIYYNSFMSDSLGFLEIPSVSSEVCKDGFIVVSGVYGLDNRDFMCDCVDSVSGIYEYFFISESFVDMSSDSEFSSKVRLKYPGDWSCGSFILCSSDCGNFFVDLGLYDYSFDSSLGLFYGVKCSESFDYCDGFSREFVFDLCSDFNFVSDLCVSGFRCGFGISSAFCYFYDVPFFSLLDCGKLVSFELFDVSKNEVSFGLGFGDGVSVFNNFLGFSYVVSFDGSSDVLSRVDAQVNVYFVDLFCNSDSCGVFNTFGDFGVSKIGFMDSSWKSSSSSCGDSSTRDSSGEVSCTSVVNPTSYYSLSLNKSLDVDVNKNMVLSDTFGDLVPGLIDDESEACTNEWFSKNVGRNQVLAKAQSGGCLFMSVYAGLDKFNVCCSFSLFCPVEGCTNHNKKYLWYKNSDGSYVLYMNPFYVEVLQLPLYKGDYPMIHDGVEDGLCVEFFNNEFEVYVADDRFVKHKLDMSDFIFYYDLWCSTYSFLVIRYESIPGSCLDLSFCFSYEFRYYVSLKGHSLYVGYVKEYLFHSDLSSDCLMSKALSVFDKLSPEIVERYGMTVEDVLVWLYYNLTFANKGGWFYLSHMQSHTSLFHSTYCRYDFLDDDDDDDDDIVMEMGMPEDLFLDLISSYHSAVVVYEYTDDEGDFDIGSWMSGVSHSDSDETAIVQCSKNHTEYTLKKSLKDLISSVNSVVRSEETDVSKKNLK